MLIRMSRYGNVLLGIGGCQLAYPFEISGVVRDPEGKPLAGVQVSLICAYTAQSSFPTVTGPNGTFKATIRVYDIEFSSQRLQR